MVIDNIALLRKNIRQQRRMVSIWQQRQTAQKMLNYAVHHAQFRSAQHIGIYLSAFGEVETRRLIELCLYLGKQVYLPEICTFNNKLFWSKLTAQRFYNRQFVLHPLKMYEAKGQRTFHISKLDLLFMPLVACDQNGMRIGMGGGFYDRTLAGQSYKPYRIGLAHDFQYINDHFLAEKWDEPIHELWTLSKAYKF